MKKIVVCILILFYVTTGLTKSQGSQSEMLLTLEKLFGRLRSSSDDSSRLRINDSIKVFIASYAESDRVFKDTFPNLRYLGQITSSDSLIKIITWNLVLKNSPGRYFCYFIRKSADGKPNRVYSLTNFYNAGHILTDTIYTESDWYGALYYDIKPVSAENMQCWVLLGINYSDSLMTRKVIDVLSFTSEDNLVFGKKWFDTGGAVTFRHVLEYSVSAVISLKFMSDSSIIFDHLVPLPPSENDGRLYYGPDYSYDSFIFNEGLWTLSINIDARNSKN